MKYSPGTGFKKKLFDKKLVLYDTLDQRFQRAFAFKSKQPSAGRASEASEGGGTSGHPGP